MSPSPLTVTSQGTEDTLLDENLLDRQIKPEDVRTTFASIHLLQSTTKSMIPSDQDRAGHANFRKFRLDLLMLVGQFYA